MQAVLLFGARIAFLLYIGWVRKVLFCVYYAAIEGSFVIREGLTCSCVRVYPGVGENAKDRGEGGEEGEPPSIAGQNRA